MTTNKLNASFLFFGFFALYLFTCGGTLVPYRDAGEMASVLATFGVAHPPGYPLYTLVGHLLLKILPFATAAYRANVVSGLFGALALVFFFLTLRKWTGVGAALVGVLVFGLSNPFWELASVSEMYTMGIFWLSLMIYASVVLENPTLWIFLFALGLGVRMDLLLLAPIFIVWFWKRKKLTQPLGMALLLGVGSSIYLYLMVRSWRDPLIDWGNPDSLLAVFNSATRKSYSGTLDLLSLSYKPGENFAANMKLYGQHLMSSFGVWGVLLSVWGLIQLRARDRDTWFFLGGLLLLAGPLFIFMANMPPNPHAVAIIEASYLVPDFLLAFFVAWGVHLLPDMNAKKYVLIAIAAATIFNASHGIARASKRNNFLTRDYNENVWRSTPKDAVLVFHKDVQLFSLWYAQLVEKRRPDVSLMSTGLSASPWFYEMRKRWGTAGSPMVSLKEAGGFAALRNAIAPRALMVGYETDVDRNTTFKPHGLVSVVSDKNPGASSSLLTDILLYRGAYHADDAADFFSGDLASDYSRAYEKAGYEAMLAKRNNEAVWLFTKAMALDPAFPRPAVDLGYLYFTTGDFQRAYDAYVIAVHAYQEMMAAAVTYNALPDVTIGIKADLATTYNNMGAVEERLGRREAARDYYLNSYTLYPNALAHFNMAVTYWRTDWPQVIEHLQKASELDPNNQEYRQRLGGAVLLSRQGAPATK